MKFRGKRKLVQIYWDAKSLPYLQQKLFSKTGTFFEKRANEYRI